MFVFILEWLEKRPDKTPYKDMSDKQKKERNTQFTEYLKEVDKDKVVVSFFKEEQDASSSKYNTILQDVKNMTYGKYFHQYCQPSVPLDKLTNIR